MNAINAALDKILRRRRRRLEPPRSMPPGSPSMRDQVDFQYGAVQGDVIDCGFGSLRYRALCVYRKLGPVWGERTLVYASWVAEHRSGCDRRALEAPLDEVVAYARGIGPYALRAVFSMTRELSSELYDTALSLHPRVSDGELKSRLLASAEQLAAALAKHSDEERRADAEHEALLRKSWNSPDLAEF